MLLERAAVMRSVTELAEQAATGHGGTLFVVGAAGLGKTAVMEETRRRAAPPARVGWARADRLESRLPYGLLTQATGRAGMDAAPARADRAARYTAALNRLPGRGDPPVLLVLDDLQHADGDSLALLSFLARRIDDRPVAIVAALRPWPPAGHDLAVRLAHDGSATIRALAPLHAAAVRALLTVRLSRAVTAAECTTARACAGNPLLLHHLAGTLCAGAGDGPAAGPLITRFADLPSCGIRYLRAAAVLGDPFRPEVAAEVAGLPDRAIDATLRAIEYGGLLAHDGGRSGFAQPYLARLLYDATAPSERDRLHRRAFHVLAGLGQDAEAAVHVHRARVADAAAIDLLHRVGRADLDRGAPASAVRHLSAAADLAGSRAAPALLSALATAHLHTGHPASAITAAARLTDTAGLRLCARAHAASGAHTKATDHFAQAEQAAQGAGGAEVLIDAALAAWPAQGPARALPLVRRAVRMCPSGHRARVAGAWIGLLSGCPPDAGLDPGAAERAGAGPDVLTTAGLIATATERHATARDLLTAALAAAERTGAVPEIAEARLALALLYLRTGPPKLALGNARRAARLSEHMPGVRLRADALQAAALHMMGRTGESAPITARVERRAEGREETLALLIARHLTAQRLYRDGRIEDACRTYDALVASSERTGVRDPCVVPWARHAIAAYLAAARPAAADRLLAHLDAAPGPAAWPRAASATGRAWLAEHTGHPDRAGEHHRAAVAVRLDHMPAEQAETLTAYGAYLRRAGHPAAARTFLAQAIHLAESHGARWTADAAREELHIAGGRHRTRTPGTHLTAQEQRVARLAAGGSTNKQIAAQLHLSVKTIEYHLRQTYTKLGITSRHQLTTAIGSLAH